MQHTQQTNNTFLDSIHRKHNAVADTLSFPLFNPQQNDDITVAWQYLYHLRWFRETFMSPAFTQPNAFSYLFHTYLEDK